MMKSKSQAGEHGVQRCKDEKVDVSENGNRISVAERGKDHTPATPLPSSCVLSLGQLQCQHDVWVPGRELVHAHVTSDFQGVSIKGRALDSRL